MKFNAKRELARSERKLKAAGVQIGDWADAANVHRTTLWRYLQGGMQPSAETFFRLQDVATRMVPESAGK